MQAKVGTSTTLNAIPVPQYRLDVFPPDIGDIEPECSLAAFIPATNAAIAVSVPPAIHIAVPAAVVPKVAAAAAIHPVGMPARPM